MLSIGGVSAALPYDIISNFDFSSLGVHDVDLLTLPPSLPNSKVPYSYICVSLKNSLIKNVDI